VITLYFFVEMVCLGGLVQKLQRDIELYVKLKFVFETMEVEVVKMEVCFLKNGS